LRPVNGHDEHGVIRIHDNHILEANGDDEPLLAENQDIVAFVVQMAGLNDIAIFIFGQNFQQRRLGADVVPAQIHRKNSHALGFFHDAVVDGAIAHQRHPIALKRRGFVCPAQRRQQMRQRFV